MRSPYLFYISKLRSGINAMGKNIAGRKFIILIFVLQTRLIPSAMISNDPTEPMQVITSFERKCPSSDASRVIAL